MCIKQVIRAATVATVLTLATACAIFTDSDTPTADNVDEKHVIILDNDSDEPYTDEKLAKLRAENIAAIPDKPDETRTRGKPARQPDVSEDRRWCQAWALDNLAPHVYAEFRQLDPDNMDDIDRSVWRDRLLQDTRAGELPTYDYSGDPDGRARGWTERSGVCWMYWSEPLNKANADKRNYQYEAECLRHVAERAESQWATLADAAVRYDDSAAYEIPNQYVRLLQWLHTPGRKLLKMDEPPQELLRRLADAPWAYDPNIPSRGQIQQALTKHGSVEPEYCSLLNATLAHRGYRTEACQGYYPQLYYGYWVPFTEPFDEPRDQLSDEELADVEHLREGPLYLPRP